MGNGSKRRGERALDTAIGALDQARATLVQRLNELDVEAMRKQGVRLAGSVRTDLRRRMQPRRRRVSPWGVAGIAGIVVLGAAVVGVGYVAYDRERREAARRRLNDVQSLARERYAELTGGRTRAEADLEERVRQAIADGGGAPQLDVVVEGRTVYLRGGVSDPAAVDAAAERIHGVAGVVAVVNLTTSAAREQAPQHS
jgi:osmotically-inducible protein OsmY